MRKLDPKLMWERAHILHDWKPPKIVETHKPWGDGLAIDTSGPSPPTCGKPHFHKYGHCKRWAGHQTAHYGVGGCNAHEGNSARGNTEGFMIMAIGYARHLNISPAQALLDEVHRTAGAIDYLQDFLSRVENHDDLLTKYAVEVDMYRKEREFGIKVSSAAINAGTMQLLGEQVFMQGASVARMIQATLGELELSPEQEVRASKLLAERMRELASEPSVDISTEVG